MRLSRRRTASLVLALLVVVLVGLLSLGRSDDHRAAPAAAAAGSEAGSSGNAPSDGTSTTKQPPKKGNAVTNGRGSEVIREPEGSGKDGLPGLGGKEASPSRPLIKATNLPKTATRQGALVAGFPIGIVPVPRTSAIRSSGVSSTSKSLQVSIQAVSSTPPASVLAFYRGKLSALGFGEVATPTVGGSKAAAFERNADHLVVTTTKSGSGGTTYSVFGTLRAGTS